MRKTSIISFALVLFMSFSVDSWAQDAPQPDQLDINTLRSPLGKGPLLYTDTLIMPNHLEYGAQMLFGFALNPFVIYNMDGDNLGDERAKVVSMLGMAQLGGYIGLFDKYLLGLSIPVGFVSGNEINDEGEEVDSLSPMAWGDLTLQARAMIYKINKIKLGASLLVSAPTGKFSENFTGEYWPAITAKAVASWQSNKIMVAANLGFLYRLKNSETEFFDSTFKLGNQFVYGLGAAYEVIEDLNITAELYGRSGLSSAVHDHNLEGGLGIDYNLGKGLHVQFGANAGILAGIGTPLARILVGIKWTPSFKDSDGDGVIDEEDKCPLIKEDIDGFEDTDGCPDNDNDNDGIPDEEDKCKGTDKDKANNFHDAAEDFDNYKDDDGCAEHDNDGDGIPDARDNCPNDKGTKATKGCPAKMVDTDNDGVSDDKDKCPKTPGSEASAGCPPEKYDSDKDGLVDAEDKCPKKPGPKEAPYKGCPKSMFDSDEDGVTDDLDKCSAKKETINGNKDFDGCPDKGDPWFKVKRIKIAGMKRYAVWIKFPSRKHEWFQGKYGRKDVLTKEGKTALDQIVLFLKAKRAIPKLQVMVFTDTLVSSEKAVKITKAQVKAIKKHATSRNLKQERLSIQAMGNAMPVYKGRTTWKHRRNRRVIFIIPE
ncbi:MAG: thrombospondin type 3 repeat-containing protein [Deltaproteobacteria bacterium]|jgi:hypothetical protein|nr:thrombospondin type 3 repeat-containing protein [Deltaproteobacteria bacterium]